jgi:hypothetical protein
MKAGIGEISEAISAACHTYSNGLNRHLSRTYYEQEDLKHSEYVKYWTQILTFD